jgi:flagellar biosynthesis/type III secretory pathway protein FliH
MSNSAVFRVSLHRALAGARLVGAPGARPAPSAREARLAQQEQALQEQAAALQAREQELAGREAALNAREQALEQNESQLGALIQSVNDEKVQLLEANEEEIISFSLSIAEKVLQYELENGNYRIGEVVRSTLQAVRDHGNLVVRVNPRDLELTRAALAELGNANISAVADESIPVASCCIETDAGKVHSEIPGRLERIERSLLKKSGGES